MKVVRFELGSIIIKGRKANGRIPTAMLVGACFWNLDHLQKVLPLYEEHFKKANKQSRQTI